MALHSNHKILTLIAKIAIPLSGLFGILFAAFSFLVLRKVRISKKGDSFSPLSDSDGDDVESIPSTEYFKIQAIYSKIQQGAYSFIRTEYIHFTPFFLVFAALLVFLIGSTNGYLFACLSGICFILGASTSLICGAVGMAIATYGNARTTISAQSSLEAAFQTSFTTAQIFGFLLPSVGLVSLFACLEAVRAIVGNYETACRILVTYALGASVMGLGCRICGGVYTKASDVGADLVGKTEKNLKEDDPRNPAVIADNVGDNVGDIAGMGADLFGSFAEATCAALIIVSRSKTLGKLEFSILLPLMLIATAVFVAMATTFVATKLWRPKVDSDVEWSLKLQVLIFCVFMIIAAFPICMVFLPSEFNVAKDGAVENISTNVKAFYCVAIGIAGGALVGLITEYYTSHSFRPVRSLSESAETGPATVIITGIALGYQSVLLPMFVLGIIMYIAFNFGEYFGIVMMGQGMLCCVFTFLLIDAMGPVCDNAGGIAEMAGLGEAVRDRTDVLDAAGNTTAAIGKGYGISLASVVGIALLISYNRLKDIQNVNVFNPIIFLGVFMGVSIPFYFSASLNKSVAYAAGQMVLEVRRQFQNGKILSGEEEPDYDKCIKVATEASLGETIFPLLLILSSVVVGCVLGERAITGYVFAAQLSAITLGIASNNMGGAWDNSKKYIESGALGEGKGKNTDVHYAAVVGDTVGDPMKDTSGPALNTLIKIMAISILVFAGIFPREPIFKRLIG